MKKIHLSGLRGKGKFALVDDEDYSELIKYRWMITSKGYAVRYICENNTVICILMHRMLLNPPHKMVVDHIDNDKLNNCRNNLRVVTIAENIRRMSCNRKNTKLYKGVWYVKTARKWVAAIKVNYVSHHLGRFNNPEDAARAYNEAAKKYFGKFVTLNVIPD